MSTSPFHFPPQPGDRLRIAGHRLERVLRALGRRVRNNEAWFRRSDLTEWKATGKSHQTSPGEEAAVPGAHRPIVLLPALPWSFRFQRPQQLARALGRRHQPVLYVDGFQRTLLGPRRRAWSPERRVTVLELWLPGRPDLFRSTLAAGSADEVVPKIAAGLREKPLAIVVQLPGWVELGKILRRYWRVPLVYDLLDLHSAFPGVPEEVADAEERLLAAADLVTASSRHLAALARGGDRRIAILPNAVALEDFTFHDRFRPDPPVIGYVGALADWFDAELVERLARQRTEWSFRLAGGVESGRVKALGRLSNVQLLGEIPYSQVPAFLSELSLLLIPFVDSPLTRAVDPVKLYEGLAAGLPVVARRLPSLEEWQQPFMYTFPNASGALSALEAALAEDTPEHSQRRQERARRETWGVRAEALLQWIPTFGNFDPAS